MFTGLIQETGSVLSVEPRGGIHRIAIHAPTLASRLHIGDSIAVSGVCLTAVAITPPEHPDRFEADLAEETVRRTSLIQLTAGSIVNLEPPTPAGTPLGGHVVQGHVDGVGRIVALQPGTPDTDTTDWRLEIEVPDAIREYVVEKGSIAIEGISLTVAGWDGERVSVAVIPHTWQHTNLRAHQPGDLVNLEADVMLKYAVQRYGSAAPLSPRQETPDLTVSYLIANGY